MRGLLRGDDDRFADHFHGRLDAASLGQQAGVERLNAMGIEALCAALAGEQRRDRGRNLGIGAGSADLEAHACHPRRSARPSSVPPRGMDWPAISSILSSSLTRFLASSARGRFQASLVLSSSRKPRAMVSASPRSIWAPAEPAAPNAIRQNCSLAEAVPALLFDQVERKLLGRLVLFFFQHFQAVDDGADRADQIVADTRAQQGREIEGINRRSRHRLVSAGHAGCADRRIDDSADLARVIHRTRTTAKEDRRSAKGYGIKRTRNLMPGSEILPVDAVGLLDDLTRIIAHACAEIRTVSPVTVVQRIKPDRSPVTVADELSEATILQGLARLLPGIPVIAEEVGQR